MEPYGYVHSLAGCYYTQNGNSSWQIHVEHDIIISV